MTKNDLIYVLSVRNRAYQLLYSWKGENPFTVRTISDEEAEQLVQLAHEVAMGVRRTQEHREIAEKVSPSMLSYVSIGKF
jgi:hypothetical protein